MKRRDFLKKASIGAAGASLAAPAIVGAQQSIQWRLAASWPKSLDTLFGGVELIARRVGEMSGGKFTIKVFAAGEIVGGLQVFDAVQAGTVECGHTAPYYYFGKNQAFAFGTNIPFGMNARQRLAWYLHGGGLDLMRELFKGYGMVNFMAGNTGCQMGGWYRKPINSLADLQGLKMRIGGTGGQVLSKLGVIPQQIAAGDIYPSLEKGTIDAAEWVGPYDDEKLGFYKVAKYYYYPGWWEGGASTELLVNEKAWAALPKEYQAMIEAATTEAYAWMLAKYDALNPLALKRLLAGGTILAPFPNDVLAAAYKASEELYQGFAASSPQFKKIYDNWYKFREDEIQWFSIAEARFDSFMTAAQRAAQRGAKK